ncbi:MAG: dihydrodipicolinate reductase C-terminal domain-containing protein [Waddliaceae bacterium]
MKIAVIGTGKTGGEILKIGKEKHEMTGFNQSSPPVGLENFDVIIVFVPGLAMEDLLEPLIRAKRPVVIGSTGFTWPDHFQVPNAPWVYASNFSLGMQKIKKWIESSLSKGIECKIHEVHHIQKQDSPSGTALSWGKWVEKATGIAPTITSERKGDVVGIHRLTIDSPFETVTIEHQAKNRGLFAEGALLAAETLYQRRTLKPGLHTFEELLCHS